jgi:aspartyl-tRNA(Asn)/glutamyl-tRNA(Gln) amidotransferase subunit B
MNYEAVIGLEVHVQIRTLSKVFTRVGAGYGHEPNTLTDPVVLALPGTLPVMNKAALDAIIKAGLLLGCEIAPVCKWDRKQYFYPDSPKNYQISQYDQPICIGGSVEIELPGVARNVMGEHKKIPLTRIHLEEDVGKLNHHVTDSLVDYNRAGTPLMEIVSEPAMHTADEAFAYLTSIRNTMIYGGISDCDMEKGQLRCDANISIRPVGETKLGTKVELKNLNSISFVRDGIAHEIKRQLAVVAAGGKLIQETRDYDGQTGTSQSLRSKEMAHDYRYFPDPDLMPVQVDAAWKEQLRAECPELPFDKQRRFLADYQVPYTITSVLVPDRELSDFFEAGL